MMVKTLPSSPKRHGELPKISEKTTPTATEPKNTHQPTVEKLASSIKNSSPFMLVGILIPLIDEIIIGDKNLDIGINISSLYRSINLDCQGENQTYRFSLRFKSICRNGQMKIVLNDKKSNNYPNLKFIKKLIQAHKWANALTAGKSIPEIANAENHNRAYISKIIRLAFLSPDIIKDILNGNHPPNLTLKQLISNKSLPLDWQKQRTHLNL